MFIDLIPSAKQIKDYDLSSRAAVVFDVLRATTTIVTALANGCQGVIPVVSIEEAQKLVENPSAISGRASKENILLAGERGGEKIAFFPHGNSPLEYPPEVIQDNFLVLTTSNGTRAIRGAMGAAEILIGSLLNLKITAQAVQAHNRDLTVVCAGSRDKYSLEDTLGAGLLIQELMPLNPILSDLALTALILAQKYQSDPLKALLTSRHGQKLIQLGQKADLVQASRLNACPVLARFDGQKVIAKNNFRLPIA